MAMSIVYIALGIAFIFKGDGIGNALPVQYMPIVGFLLIIYGVFRGYRAYIVERRM